MCNVWFFTTPYLAVTLDDAAINMENNLVGEHNVMHETGLIVNFFLAYTQQAHISLVCKQL